MRQKPGPQRLCLQAQGIVALALHGAELGLSLALDRGATQLSADYAGQFRADYASHALTLNGAIRF